MTDETVKAKMEKLQDGLDEVKRHYLLPIALDPTASEIKCITKETPEWIAAPAEVFLENIEAAVTTVRIPYTK